MSSPVPGFLPWATAPAFVPIATAFPTPVPLVVPLDQTGQVKYPSICPSIVCSTFSFVDNSINLYHDAVNFASQLVWGKSPAADPNDGVLSIDMPTPTRKLQTQTVPAPDVQRIHLLAPGSYPLWSPWNEDPIVTWVYVHNLAQICNKTWWALEKMGVFDFTQKHCPIAQKIGPYIWHTGLPLVFSSIMLLVQILWVLLLVLLMGCLAVAGKAFTLVHLVTQIAFGLGLWVLERGLRSTEYVTISAGQAISVLKNVGPWVLEDVIRSIEYVSSSIGEALLSPKNVGSWIFERVAQYMGYFDSLVTVLTFRDYVQIATIIILASVCKFLLDRETMLRNAFACQDQRLNHLTGGLNMVHDYAIYWRDCFPGFRSHVTEHLENLYGLSNANSGGISALRQFNSDATNVFFAYRDQVHNEHEALHGELNSHGGHIIDLLGKTTATNIRVDSSEEKNDVLQQLINIIDGRLGAYRRDMFTMHQIIETRSKAVEERFEDVETVVEEVEIAVQHHDADIRVIRDGIHDFKAHVKKQHDNFHKYFRIASVFLNASDADIRVIRDSVTDLNGQAGKAVQRIWSLEILAQQAKEVEESMMQQLAAVQGNLNTINQTITDSLEKLNNTEKEATHTQTQISGLPSKLRALEECFATYNTWCADTNTRFHTLIADMAKISLAMAKMRNTSILHKDYILYLFSKVLPEFSHHALQSYIGTVADAQPGSPLQVDVVLNEQMRTTLLRKLSEDMVSKASQASHRTAPAHGQQRDEVLMPAPLRIQKEVAVDDSAKALLDSLLRGLSSGAASSVDGE
ncbi:hypothetical protein PMIN06_013054 [Paraphaeosphaeria minitans]